MTRPQSFALFCTALGIALLAGSGCSRQAGPSREITAQPRTQAQQQSLQVRMQNDPTMGRVRQGGAAPGSRPAWMQPHASGGGPTATR